MTTYWVISVKANGVERDPLGTLFATPFQAACYQEQIYKSAGFTFGVRPATWQEREKRMMESGAYTPPVWSEESWWYACAERFKDHFVHVSLVDPAAVAFTEDPVKGEADRQTPIRPGKYLQKFLGAGPSGTIEHGPMKGWPPQVTKMQIAYYAAWHQTGKRPPNDDELHFTEDPAEMVRLYEEGPESCMMGKGWSVEYHPVRVYAGGGLALAYMTNASAEVVGRALCWPSKEVFGRVYPTPNGPELRSQYDELMARLKAKGWRSIEEDNSVFEGALLSKITNRYGSYLMPYLDHAYGVIHAYKNGQEWWQMTQDADHQENTDGTMVDNEPDWTCDACDNGFSDDYNSTCVYNRWMVGTNARGGHPYSEQYWCTSCRDEDAFYCDGSDEYYRCGTATAIEADCTTYESNWFHANGGWQSAVSEDYYFTSDDPPVRLADGSLIHEDEVEEHAFRCLADGQLWSIEFASDAVPGYHQHYDTCDPHPAEQVTLVPVWLDPEDEGAWAVAYAPLPQPEIHFDPIVASVYRDLITPIADVPYTIVDGRAVVTPLTL